jgi:hypothetical protein
MFAKTPAAHAGWSHAVGRNLAVPSIVMAASAEDSCGKNVRVADNFLQKQQKQRGPPFNGAN